ncbi:ribonuclease Z [Striga asiatica]|uniref:Ribonuclease Z n=1 Tax=Striga asiatica TaxID=4170 RepID=A0A5A7PSA8_STRAF|nr:ribonuclease Z [Striga asiatica]
MLPKDEGEPELELGASKTRPIGVEQHILKLASPVSHKVCIVDDGTTDTGLVDRAKREAHAVNRLLQLIMKWFSYSSTQADNATDLETLKITEEKPPKSRIQKV